MKLIRNQVINCKLNNHLEPVIILDKMHNFAFGHVRFHFVVRASVRDGSFVEFRFQNGVDVESVLDFRVPNAIQSGFGQVIIGRTNGNFTA